MSEDSEDFIFQQDRAPPHRHLDVRRFLNESLPEQWVGCIRKEDLALQFWPLRSPDLTPCDFFLWGFVKEAVCVPFLPTTLDDLKNRITTAVNSVTQNILLQVYNEFSYQLDQGFSKGVPQHTSVPRNFWTVPQEKVLGKCEHIKKGFVY